MIVFNNLGHSYKNKQNADPIVWVDAQDATTYTLSGNDVLTLDNKGSLGGAMTLNGSVKFANSGFESWSGSDYITRDLGETFLPTNSFTMVTTFDFQNIAQNSNRGWWGSIYGDISNRVSHIRENSVISNISFDVGTLNRLDVNYILGLKSMVTSYDITTNTLIQLNYDGSNQSYVNITYNNINNSVIWLLRAGTGAVNTNSGQNNPLHEFRLYDRAFTLTEMQDLQTELNNKYTP